MEKVPAIKVRLSKVVIEELQFLEVDGYAGDEPGSAFEEMVFALEAAGRGQQTSDGVEIALSPAAARELARSLANACDIWADKAGFGGSREALRQSNHIRSGRAAISRLRAALVKLQ